MVALYARVETKGICHEQTKDELLINGHRWKLVEIIRYRFFPVCSADRPSFREGDAGLKTGIYIACEADSSFSVR